MKIPISLTRKPCIKIIIYLGNMIVMGATLNGFLMARDNLIYLLQNLSFLINIQEISIELHIGVVLNSHNITWVSQKRKFWKLIKNAKSLLVNHWPQSEHKVN